MAAVAFRGTTYPVVLPKLKDARLHLAATIMSLQVLGQVAFHFRLSIAQILLCLGTTAAIETVLVVRKQRVLMWPASALLTGNGVAFVLRVPGTAHGDWWSLRGWWIFVVVSAGSLLSKHVLQWRGTHWFNPSNVGLVVCFLALGRTRVEPLDFWWGPMSWWMGLTLAIIVAGGFAILTRLHLLRVALGFWAAFAGSVGVLALSGHSMTARWNLGPIAGFHFWWVLVTSPEVLVFLFFMITDPKTAPAGGRARVVYAVALGLLAGVLIAPTTAEYAAKVALLSSLVVVCAAMPLLRFVPRKALVLAAAPALALAGGVLVFANGPSPSFASPTRASGATPRVQILPSPGVQSQLDRATAEAIASSLVAATGSAASGIVRVHLEPGTDQDPPTAVAQLAGVTYRLHVAPTGTWALAGAPPGTIEAVRKAPAPKGLRLEDVAASVGLRFRQGSFRFGMSSENQAMMGGGVCFLDYNGDGWQDLFAVNSYASADTAEWESHGGLPRSRLFENDHGHFHDVTASTGAGLQVQGDGCAAADLDGDGRPDLVVTTTTGVELLWNTGHGFRPATLPVSGWYAGAAIADVNGDGRPDVFVAGYADPSEPVHDSIAGFPTNLEGVRDLLFLNEGGRRFREAGAQAGLEAAGFRHGLGAEFVDVNGDGRPDLYVANDEDPNQLYVNVPWPGGAAADPAGLGFRFEDRAVPERVADGNAGMGIAVAGAGRDLGILVTNSRHQRTAAYARRGDAFADARPLFDPALGTDFAGWGVTWADLANSGRPDLVLAAGAIPVESLRRDAEPLRVLAPAKDGYGDAQSLVPGRLVLNGRGLAAADVGNDGRVEIAVNTVGGDLVLLRPTGPSGHWLDVQLSREVPGAVVTVVLADGTVQSRSVAAGSSYLSSEDPRLHFGLGATVRVARLVVRYPWGATTRVAGVRADRILTVHVPSFPQVRTVASAAHAPRCTTGLGRRSVATVWDAAATTVLREGAVSEPVQARDLYDLSLAMRQAEAASPGDPATAIDYAAYRVLVWQASFGTNLARSFALLERRLRTLCGSPSFTSTTGTSAAAIGNRVGAAAVAAGRIDGSHEELRFADPSFVSQNAPLVVAHAGSTAHDATFWQPLGTQSFAGAQTFIGAQWGDVRTFARKVHVGPPPFADPSAPAYVREAVAVIRATAGAGAKPFDTSPAAWNDRARTAASGRLAADVRLYLGLNGALNDAAVASFGAKRTYDAPRPISMIRYLAFAGKLPHAAGLIESRNGVTMVRSQDRWIRGDAWKPPAATPPSPGWISEASTFAYAASGVLAKLTGRSFAAEAERAATIGLAGGIETPPDEAAGRRTGEEVARRALARLR